MVLLTYNVHKYPSKIKFKMYLYLIKLKEWNKYFTYSYIVYMYLTVTYFVNNE